MEFESIVRSIYVEAPVEVAFDVVTSPEHIREWWNGARTDLTATPGEVAELVWDQEDGAAPYIQQITVLEVDPPRLFSFTWVPGESDAHGVVRSLLVSFELTPSGRGTTIQMTETGFREMGWDIAVLEATYAQHAQGWDIFVPSLAGYLARLVATS